MLDAGPVRPEVPESAIDPRVRAAAKLIDKANDGQPATVEEWAQVCEACGLHPSIKGFASEVKPFPGEVFVGLLTHTKFAVRMGALEVLENRKNDDFGFDPWEPASDKSIAAIARWKAWISAPKDEPAKPKDAGLPALDDAKFRGYLSDLVATQAEKRERATEALSHYGMIAVAGLEQYIHDTPQLNEGVRARLKEAQYRLVIHSVLPKEAAKLAKDLVYGPRDARLEAMVQLPRLRLKAIPILVEFLPDTDALVREAAMDALMQCGGSAVYDVVEARLKIETDENVINAVLRHADPKDSRGGRIVASYVHHESEDLCVAALHALSLADSSLATSEVEQSLADSRWRVRVAALEYAGEVKATSVSARTAVLKALEDSDEFVRYAAMKAAAEMSLSDAVPLITNIALKDHGLIGAATEALMMMQKPLPDSLVKAMQDTPGDALLPAIRALAKAAGDDRHGTDVFAGKKAAGTEKVRIIIRSLLAHKDADVRTVALRALAFDLSSTEDRKLMLNALQQANDEARVTMLGGIPPGAFNFRDAPDDAPATPDGEEDIFTRIAREPAPRNPAQDAVYAAFRVPLDPPPAPVQVASSGTFTRSWAPLEKDFYDLFATWMRKSTDELSIQSAIHLMCSGSRDGCLWLTKQLPTLEVHHRARIAEMLEADTLKLPPVSAAQALLRALMRDESPEVRTDTVRGAIEKGQFKLLLEELAAPDPVLHAVDAYSYGLENAAKGSSNKRQVVTWATELLKNPQARPDMKTLALALLGTVGGADALAAVEGQLHSPNVWMRRAAWRSYGRLDRAAFETKASALVTDSSAKVREVLTVQLMGGERSEWVLWFGEREFEEESAPYSYSSRRANVSRLNDTTRPLLQKLAADASPDVQARAMIALLTNREEADPLRFHEALEALDEKTRKALIPNLVSNHFQTLGPRYGFLLDYVQEKHFGDEWKQIVARMRGGVKKDEAFTSFASLVKLEPPPEPIKIAATAPVAGTDSQQPMLALFFYKPGCKDCERLRELITNLVAGVPNVKLEEVNIESPDGARWNEVLCSRFNVEPNHRQVAPALFCQTGALVKTDLERNRIISLLEQSRAAPVDAAWSKVASVETAEAGRSIEQRFENFSLVWVLLAGLLDGINPCAFATIIFFLSYLHIARRSPREILMVGGAFILAVFLAYFVVGLGLSHVLAKLEALSWLRVWLNRLLALVAIVLAWLSFRDGLKAMRGQLADMSLQLPDFLKTRIRNTVREGTRSHRFVIAAFVSGIVISFLELACTGQVYLPTILYMLKQGRLTAVGYLLLYNLAFIVPLIVIFALAFAGMKSEALIRFQQRHTATVKFATAALFVVLLVVLLSA